MPMPTDENLTKNASNAQTAKSSKKKLANKATPKSKSAAKRDAELLKQIAENRDAQALTQLFKIYAPKLKGWLMARGNGSGTAEDIVQDIMITCWTRAHLFDSRKASFATWVYRMTRNRWIDHKRKHGRMEIRDPELMKVISDDILDSAEIQFMALEANEDLYVHIEKLTDAQRQALQMAFMEFKTHKEIAAETGLPLGTVKTRIRSGIQSLQTHMNINS